MPKKHQLSFCEIEQLSENVFELIPKKGITVDKNVIDEAKDFWNKLRDRPFGLLINCKNQFTRLFVGSLDMGKTPIQPKTALVFAKKDARSAQQLKTTLEIKATTGHFFHHKVFTDREEALEWLSDI